MGVDAVSIGLSGVRASSERLRNSAHNVANSLTEGFHNRRTSQVALRDGGTRAVTSVDSESKPVDFVGEFVQQKLAEVQSKASARSLETSELPLPAVERFGGVRYFRGVDGPARERLRLLPPLLALRDRGLSSSCARVDLPHVSESEGASAV